MITDVTPGGTTNDCTAPVKLNTAESFATMQEDAACGVVKLTTVPQLPESADADKFDGQVNVTHCALSTADTPNKKDEKSNFCFMDFGLKGQLKVILPYQ